jgi:hypothetical protein
MADAGDSKSSSPFRPNSPFLNACRQFLRAAPSARCIVSCRLVQPNPFRTAHHTAQQATSHFFRRNGGVRTTTMSTNKLRKAEAIEPEPKLSAVSDPEPVYAIATGLHLGDGPNRQEVYTCTASDENSQNWLGTIGTKTPCPHCKDEHEVIPFTRALEERLIPLDSDWSLGIWIDDFMAAWVRKLRLDGATIS